MKLQCPIPQKYFVSNGKYCKVNQFFGENKSSDPNRTVNFYGPTGHNGWDIATKGAVKYLYNNLKGFIVKDREDPEEAGLIPILAAHDGYVVSPYNDDKKEGVYVKIQDAKDPDYETKYFHLDKVRVWKGDKNRTAWEQKYGENFIKAGTVIGWGGNSGRFTTGAHLHLTLRYKGKPVDPMPFFQDDTVWIKGGRFYYKGREITKKEAEQVV